MQKALSYAKVFVSWWGLGLDISFGQQVGCVDHWHISQNGEGMVAKSENNSEGVSCRCPMLGHVHSGFFPK